MNSLLNKLHVVVLITEICIQERREIKGDGKKWRVKNENTDYGMSQNIEANTGRQEKEGKTM